MASPAVPGLLLCFVAMVLLGFVSVSSPIWNEIFFLEVSTSGTTIRYGVFGFTGSGHSVGYHINPALFGLPNSSFDENTIHHLTFILILHPIAAGLSALAVLFGLCGAGYSRAGTIFMTLSASLATTVTLAAWVVDMVIWSLARNRIRSVASQESPLLGNTTVTVEYGNAIWLTLGALVALLLASCASAFGSCGRYSRNERWRGKAQVSA